MKAILSILLAGCVVLQAQAPKKAAPAGQQQKRDLKLEPDETIDIPVAGKVVVPKSYAVVIGVSQYPKLKPEQQLKFTERDADSMFSVLISKEGGNFKQENVKKLVGAKATLANIKREIETWLPAVTNDDDRVIIYFAGHGFVYKGKVYLAPTDFDYNDPVRTGYSADDLSAAFGSKIKGKWKVLLTDSCHSGAVNYAEGDAQTINGKLADLNRSTFMLTASRDRELSYEGPEFGGGHGIFTYFVVKGMEGEADESHDGIVTADELSNYVQRNVREESSKRQNPMIGGSFNNSMMLAFIPAGAKLGTPPPAKEGSLVFVANMDSVEIFVDGKSAGVLDKNKPFSLPGISAGVHQIKAVRMGYEPDGPREEIVYPGQETTVNIKILIPRRRTKALLDKMDKATEEYQKARGAEQYRKAAKDFADIVNEDPKFSQALLFLARANRDLNQYQDADKYFKKALEVDPDYLEARATYAGMLFDRGDTDEAIRQLNMVVQRDKNNAMSHYLLAQAYRVKELYPQAVESAEIAVKLTPNNADAYFWLAESLRMQDRFGDSIPPYRQYLKLSNFESTTAAKFGYYAIGFKFFKKKRAATQDVWKDLRSLAYFGLCDAERHVNHFDNAITYCQKALSFDNQDPFTHLALANAYVWQADVSGDTSLLPAARKHFQQMITLNPDLEETKRAKEYIARIDKFLNAQ